MEQADTRRRRSIRECRDYERIWQGRCVDKNLKDDWLERLNQLSCFNLISICEGHAQQRPCAHINLRLKSDWVGRIEAVWREIVSAEQSLSRAASVDSETSLEFERRWRYLRESRSENLVIRVQRVSSRNGWNDDIEAWFIRTVEFVEHLDNFVRHELSNPPSIQDRWYFAYGSNLLTIQKKQRTGHIRCAVRCMLPRHRVVFNKRCKRGVAANIVADTAYCVWGVAYLCDPEAISKMDDKEVGYRHEEVSVITESGKELNAITYVAIDTCEERLPAMDYLKRILSGARHHGLPIEYIDCISSIDEQGSH